MQKKFNNDKIKASIPEYDDIRLRKIFFKCIENLVNNEQVDDAREILSLIQSEWAKRVSLGEFKKYKATTPDEGMLKGVHYQVGKREGKPENVRHELLNFIMTGTLPPVGSPPYYEEWGKPLSTKRYQKLERVLTAFIRKFKNSENHIQAVSEWSVDKLYLEENWKDKVD